MAPEFEFHVFERVKVVEGPYKTMVAIGSAEVDTPGLTPPIAPKGGYLRSRPADRLHDLRCEITRTLVPMGVSAVYHHHEVGAPGQCEIEIDRSPLLTAAERPMLQP